MGAGGTTLNLIGKNYLLFSLTPDQNEECRQQTTEVLAAFASCGKHLEMSFVPVTTSKFQQLLELPFSLVI